MYLQQAQQWRQEGQRQQQCRKRQRQEPKAVGEWVLVGGRVGGRAGIYVWVWWWCENAGMHVYVCLCMAHSTSVSACGLVTTW
jgi:hypothetical protein